MPAEIAANRGVEHTTANMNGHHGGGDDEREAGNDNGDKCEFKPILHNHSNGVDGTTIVRNGGGGGDEDEYLNIVDQLSFQDENHKNSLLSRLTTLRRNRELCDLVLLVDKHELYVHKAVLAAVSPTLLEMLTAGREDSPSSGGSASKNGHQDGSRGQQQQTQTQAHQQRDLTPPEFHQLSSPAFFELKDVDYDCFEALINYAYSGSLQICRKKVADLYKTACRFRMRPCALACAKYLANELSPQNCIGIRKCANFTNDSLLASKVDAYIQANFAEIFENSKEFVTLPSVQVEVILRVNGDRSDLALSIKEQLLAMKVLDWLQQQAYNVPERVVFRMDMLTEKTHMLYLGDDMTLQDCCDLDDSSAVGSCDMIQDYKKSSRRNSSHHVHVNGTMTKTRSRSNMLTMVSPSCTTKQLGRVSSTESMTSAASDAEEVEWKIIAVLRLSESYCTALAVINRQLAALSIRVIDGGGPLPTTMNINNNNNAGYYQSYYQQNPQQALADMNGAVPLASLAAPRCAVGAGCLGGKLVACGGYDRGECLNSVEQYDPSTNTWTMLPPMSKERGRFNATVIDQKIYVVGGSDGARDLNTAECYDSDSGTWTKLSPMLSVRSNHGVTSMDGYVYAVGGCQWQRPLKHCERYDCVSDKWTAVAPLQHARYQAGCCCVSNEIVAVGGFDTWTCTNTVECYDPETNSWRFLPSLGTARRGCGVAVLGDNLYVVGGSDGLQALCSVEVLDLSDPSATWKPGPPLNTPRDNVRAVVVPTVNGDRLYVLGGFNGKSFLNTIEYLDEETQQWRTSTHKPATSS